MQQPEKVGVCPAAASMMLMQRFPDMQPLLDAVLDNYAMWKEQAALPHTPQHRAQQRQQQQQVTALSVAAALPPPAAAAASGTGR
jgi:hypothetical protein